MLESNSIQWASLLAVAMSVGPCSGPAFGDHQWPDQRQVGPLLCHADFPLDKYLPFFQEIAELQTDLVATLGVGKTREYIHLYLFSKRSTYQRYLREHFPGVPYRRALFVKGHGPGMVFAYASGDFQVDLRHECTHALLHGSLPMVPLWLDEGLAEYFEMPVDQRQQGSPHAGTVRRAALFRRVADVQSLEAISGIDRMSGRDYRHAWSWVHFMLHGPAVAGDELRSFLGDIQDHVPPGRLSDRLSRKIPDLNREFVRHFRR